MLISCFVIVASALSLENGIYKIVNNDSHRTLRASRPENTVTATYTRESPGPAEMFELTLQSDGQSFTLRSVGLKYYYIQCPGINEACNAHSSPDIFHLSPNFGNNQYGISNTAGELLTVIDTSTVRADVHLQRPTGNLNQAFTFTRLQ
ncbi:unnamed protein product [Absidia cylindrospora]